MAFKIHNKYKYFIHFLKNTTKEFAKQINKIEQ